MNNDIYDSRADTHKHIAQVQEYAEIIISKLKRQVQLHDASKLVHPEKTIFDKMTPKLKHLTYGTPEYEESLKQLGDALKHHYEYNRHHPEHHANGILDMTLVDVIEMFCDWCSSTIRHDNGNIYNSIKTNNARFGTGFVLEQIFQNTAFSFTMGNRANEVPKRSVYVKEVLGFIYTPDKSHVLLFKPDATKNHIGISGVVLKGESPTQTIKKESSKHLNGINMTPWKLFSTHIDSIAKKQIFVFKCESEDLYKWADAKANVSTCVFPIKSLPFDCAPKYDWLIPLGLENSIEIIS